MKEKIIRTVKTLGIEELNKIEELTEFKGDFLNLECVLPNGKKAKILDDQKTYYAYETSKNNSERCYGVAADDTQIAIYEYGNHGKDAILVMWIKL